MGYNRPHSLATTAECCSTRSIAESNHCFFCISHHDRTQPLWILCYQSLSRSLSLSQQTVCVYYIFNTLCQQYSLPILLTVCITSPIPYVNSALSPSSQSRRQGTLADMCSHLLNIPLLLTLQLEIKSLKLVPPMNQPSQLLS